MRPWTELSVSPRTVLFRWKSFLAMLTTPRRENHGGGRRRGVGKGRHGAEEDATVEARAERSTRVHWFGCGVRLPSPQGWPVVGIVGAVRPPRQHSRPWEAGACGTTGTALGGWSKKTRD